MTDATPPRSLRRLCLVLGDQLDAASAVFDGFDPNRDALVMIEALEEARYVAQHKKRLALFFAAMRHFAAEQEALGRPVLYRRLDAPDPAHSLADGLRAAIAAHAPERVEVVQPGDHRVLSALRAVAPALVVLEDRHFLAPAGRFDSVRAGRKRFVLEDYYRAERRRTGWLMAGDAPVGGAWNLDAENRKAFGRAGPGFAPERRGFAPDAITAEVLRMVAARFPDAPGSLEGFDEAVTAADARALLAEFVERRLPRFGDHQDAIASGYDTLFHARLSAAMNLKLLSPRAACEAALAAYAEGRAPLNAVEGFVRQVLGWREFVRGVYWAEMPGYAARNALGAELEVPAFFWTGATDAACLADALGGLVRTGYAHHIKRLMVMGLYMMLLGVQPYAAHAWHMSMYLDAVDWVSLPNVLGMSQHGDGGQVGTKPYAASGAYIDRMSDCCRGCRYDPKQATGPRACPFTALYWDFLARHRPRFAPNRRMTMQLASLDRKDPAELAAIRAAADRIRAAAT